LGLGIKTMTEISPSVWVKISSVLMGLMLLLIAFNFAMDNQRNIEIAEAFSEVDGLFNSVAGAMNKSENGFGATGSDYLVLWLSSLDSNTVEYFREQEKFLPTCATHYVANKPSEITYDFSVDAFWFNFPNGSQLEFSREGKINCYVATENESVKVKVDSCDKICPNGISDFQPKVVVGPGV